MKDFTPSYLMYKDEIKKHVNEVIDSGYILNGKYNDLCVNELKKLTGKKYAILFSSATTALECLMRYDDNHIATPTINFVSVPYIAKELLGKRVTLLARTQPLSGAIKSEDILDTVWHVALGGVAGADYIDSVKPEDFEDASQSFMTYTPAGMVGTLGRAGVYSFTFNKFMSSGEGGAVVTDDKDIYDELIRYKSFGTLGHEKYLTKIGFNYRMSEINAAMLYVQLKNAKKTLNLMAKKKKAYSELMKARNIAVADDLYDNCTRMIVQVPNGFSVDTVRELLKYEYNIPTPRPIMDFSMGDKYPAEEPEKGWDTLLCLPFHHEITRKEMLEVRKALLEIFNT